MNKICLKCNTEQSKKWYKFENGYICQKDYRHLRYLVRKDDIKIYQNEYYHNNIDYIKKRNLEKYHTKNLKKISNEKCNDKKCYQRTIRDSILEKDLLRIGKHILDVPLEKYTLQLEFFKSEHRYFIETYEWLGSIGNSPKWTFTARCEGHLAGVILFNEPNCYSKKILNIDTKKIECLIQRGACASWAHKHLGSKLIRFACNWLSKNTEKKIFVAYSDPRANEIGTIYQACGFDYLGNKFGAKNLLQHPTYKNGKPYSIQSLRRTATLKIFLKSKNIIWNKEWEKPSGYKDLSKLPEEYKMAWYQWIRNIIFESKKIRIDQKGKYVLILGKDRREQKYLDKQKCYIKFDYPKR